jgi:hypothetical protein
MKITWSFETDAFGKCERRIPNFARKRGEKNVNVIVSTDMIRTGRLANILPHIICDYRRGFLW